MVLGTENMGSGWYGANVHPAVVSDVLLKTSGPALITGPLANMISCILCDHIMPDVLAWKNIERKFRRAVFTSWGKDFPF